MKESLYALLAFFVISMAACGGGGGGSSTSDGVSADTPTTTGDTTTEGTDGETSGGDTTTENGSQATGYTYGGTVRDGSADGPALAGATVTVGASATTTGADGTYSLTILPGEFGVTVSKEGYIDVTATVTVTDSVSGADWYLVSVPADGVVNTPPAPPTITGDTIANQARSVAAYSASYATTLTMTVIAGDDPDGDQVATRCTASGSTFGGKTWESRKSGTGGVANTLSLQFTQAGSQAVRCQTVDERGGISDTTTHTIWVNKSGANHAPRTPFPYVEGSTIYENGTTMTVTVTMGVDDDGDAVALRCDMGGGVTENIWTEPATTTPKLSKTFTLSSVGDFVITCEESDTNGARSSGIDAYYTVLDPGGSTPPTTPLVRVKPGVLYYRGEDIVVSINAHDPDQDRIGLNCAAPQADITAWSEPLGNSPGSWSKTLHFVNYGSHLVSCAAFDETGLTGNTGTTTVTITQPSVTLITPTTATVGTPTKFTAHGQTPPGIEFAAQHCDNIADNGGNSMSHSWTCTPNKAGTWKIGVRDPYDGAVLYTTDMTVN